MVQKNSADEGAVGKQQDRRKSAEDREAQNVIDTMGTKQGRAVIRMILRECQFTAPSYNVGLGETFETVTFREGKKAVGNRVLAIIHDACPEMYAVMMSEGKPKAEVENDEKLDT